MSRRSFAPTPGTGKSPPGSPTPRRHSKRSGKVDLALEWAKQATDFGQGHQSTQAAEYWCQLLTEHRPGKLLEARLDVFRRWPSVNSADRLHKAAGGSWPRYRDEVIEGLTDRPRDAVLFALLSLKDPPLAWDLAHSLTLEDPDTWTQLAKAYEKIDPLVLPVLTRLVENDLQVADAYRYQVAARRLKKMRQLANGTDKATDVDDFIAELRENHRRRPRLQQEFDRAGLP